MPNKYWISENTKIAFAHKEKWTAWVDKSYETQAASVSLPKYFSRGNDYQI